MINNISKNRIYSFLHMTLEDIYAFKGIVAPFFAGVGSQVPGDAVFCRYGLSISP